MFTRKLFRAVSFLALAALLCTVSAAFASTPEQQVMERWSKKEFRTDSGSRLEVTITYYSAEYIEALVKSEADKNLWTNDEMENYKYNLLKTLNLVDSIPIMISLYNTGDSLHMAPFDRNVELIIGNKTYKPISYDPRFNFKLQGGISGMVYFPRFDEKTNKDLTEGAGKIRVLLKASLGIVMKASDMSFMWDIDKDDPGKLYKGAAMDRLEKDRLIRRLEILNKDKKDLEAKLGAVNNELDVINKRINELN